MKTVRWWPPLKIGAAWIKRTAIMRRTSGADVYLAWIRLEDGRAACTSRSVAVWGVTGARAECVKWIQEQRRGIRARSMLAPHRFPPVVVRTVRGGDEVMSTETSLIVVVGKICGLLGSLPDDASRRRVIEAIQCLLEPEPTTTTLRTNPDEKAEPR